MFVKIHPMNEVRFPEYVEIHSQPSPVLGDSQKTPPAAQPWPESPDEIVNSDSE